MNNKKSQSSILCFSFNAKVWKYQGAAGWHFVTLPKLVSKKIRSSHHSSEEGWGRLPTKATIGKTTWKTAIWFDTKAKSYLLPVKAIVRKNENLLLESAINVKLEF